MRKLLIAEDDKDVRLLYKKEFTDNGFKAVLARAGKEAITKAQKIKPDRIIMDARILLDWAA